MAEYEATQGLGVEVILTEYHYHLNLPNFRLRKVIN